MKRDGLLFRASLFIFLTLPLATWMASIAYGPDHDLMCGIEERSSKHQIKKQGTVPKTSVEVL